MTSAPASLESIYPEPPANVPKNLTRPTSRYRFHAWLALLGLLLFALLYIALTAWFAWSAYRLFAIDSKVPDASILVYVKGFGAAFLAVFLIKGLFFKTDSGQPKDFEVTPEQEPQLFAFLERLANETGAPKPHRVFLSADVNASVSYDLTILNFIFPSRKNLNIGLGLVNALSLSEFKAVLAHEFGHFAQNTMAVGRWVYMAQQVATQLIFHRNFLDAFLSGLSRFDLRFAWIGWLLKLVVWSIRSVLDSALGVVMLAHRALSREMEFQADLVAVKSTGSDALIHALFKLGPADEAWAEAKNFVIGELDAGHATSDVFAIQSEIIDQRRRILDDPEFGHAPALPQSDQDKHRIFTADVAQPPQMWSTHPQNHLRENNAKQTYIPAEIKEGSAWEAFADPEELKTKVSAHLLAEFDKPVRPLNESLNALTEKYQRHRFDPRYRGAYLGRSIVCNVRAASDLYAGQELSQSEQLYPESLTDLLERERNLKKEKALISALRSRELQPPGGVIRFRGNVIKRKDLGDALETVTSDLEEAEKELGKHDQACRSYHLGLARRNGNGWEPYLKGCIEVLHYADHSLRDLQDAADLLHNTYTVVIADGNVSSRELKRLLGDACGLHSVLATIHNQKEQLRLDSSILSHLDAQSWAGCFEEFKSPPPLEHNLSEWLSVHSGWVGEMQHALGSLRSAALETLLDSEKMLDETLSQGERCDVAPAPSSAPESYKTLLPGEERKLQTKLNFWDSFQTSSGFFPALVRFVISGLIVGGAICITYDS
ncbi:M48 family metallopeptidase [Verrucomicrobiales bacterium]|nr:M48 family metallopeptidase [Verrucomicrobiales bacterium]